MAKATNKLTFEQIMTDLRAGKYAPIYFLMGEEPYFIDKITEYIEHNIIPDEDKSMNQSIIFATKDTKMEDVIMEAKQFPFGASKRVVIVKEAQNLKKNIDKLEFYLQHYLESTILLFVYKYDRLDSRKKYVKAIEEKGVLFTSSLLYDNQLPVWIKQYCRENNFKIDDRAVNLLVYNVGNNLLRLASELDKLKIYIGDKGDIVNADIVSKSVGISKDYDNFALTKALGDKNELLTYQIVNYFGKNPKNFAMPLTLITIHNFFMKLLLYQRLRDKSKMNASKKLKVNPFFIDEYARAAKFYSSNKIIEILGDIRTADAKSKGFGQTNVSAEDLLKELCFKILN